FELALRNRVCCGGAWKLGFFGGRLMKSRWTHLSRNVLTILNEISDCCCLKLLDVIMKYQKIIPSSSSLSSQILASPSKEKGNRNNLTIVLGTSGCLNVDVTLLKKQRWLCGSCLSILASPSKEKGNSNNLTVALGTSGCLNMDVTLLKKHRWLCGSCLPVNWLSVCLLCHPIRNEEIASWDGAKSTWGGRVRVFGTVSVSLSAQEIVWGRGRFWRERTMPNIRSEATMTREVVDNLITLRVAEALEACDAAKNLEPLVKGGDEQGGKNGDDYKGGNGGGDGNGNRYEGVNGNGNGGGHNNRNGNGNEGGNGYENHNVNFEGFMPVARECTYQDFLKCQPLNFKGVEGVVGMVLDEEERVERFIGGYARSAENKSRFDNNLRDNHRQQPAFKWQNVRGQNVAKAYTAGHNDKKGTLETRLETQLGTMKLQQRLMPLEEDELTPIPMLSRNLSMEEFQKSMLSLKSAKYQVVIVYDKKIVRIPYGDEKGGQVYLAQVTSKKMEDKSEEKRLEEVPIV
nr:hypothetical protein [Tanacetum cinerariifolium]